MIATFLVSFIRLFRFFLTLVRHRQHGSQVKFEAFIIIIILFNFK
jgi:hypothetical protein